MAYKLRKLYLTILDDDSLWDKGAASKAEFLQGPILGCRQPSSPKSSHGGKDEGALWALFYQGSDPRNETSALVGLLWWLNGKESDCQCRRCGFDSWVEKIPWRRKWLPTPVFLPGKSHGQRSLVGYSLWDRKDSDTAEQLNQHHNHQQQLSWLDHIRGRTLDTITSDLRISTWVLRMQAFRL